MAGSSRKMRATAAVAPLLACLASPALAQNGAKDMQLYNTTVVLGEPFPANLSADVETLYREANASPNKTRSVRFKPFAGYENDRRLADTEWTWRINVTEFALPGTSSGRPLNAGGGNFTADGDIRDPHVVNTVHDFSWPGGGDMAAAGPVCVTGLVNFFVPNNVTNGYGEDAGDSASCAPVFGQDCVDALVRLSAGAPSPSGPEAKHGATRCGRVRVTEWLAEPACAGSWGYAGGLQDGIGAATLNLNAANDTKLADVSLASGRGFWSARTDAFAAGEAGRWLDDAAARLHVLLLAPDVGGPNNAARPPPRLLCMRVDTAALDEGEDEKAGGEDGDDNNDNDDDDDDENAGRVLEAGRGWVYVALAVGTALLARGI